jgi:thiamine-phosphate pyrophosphorylase
MPKINDYSLYLVISEKYSSGRKASVVAKEALAAGVDIIQLREKDKTSEELIKLAREISGFCKAKNKIFIVNDDPLITKETTASGVHVGQEDIKKTSLAQIRNIIGQDRIIGISTHSLSEFEKANESEADYISFGPIFPTPTKNYSIGTRDIKKVLAMTSKPVFFIGGINLSNIDELLNLGIRNIALIRAILKAEDIRRATELFKEKLREAAR